MSSGGDELAGEHVPTAPDDPAAEPWLARGRRVEAVTGKEKRGCRAALVVVVGCGMVALPLLLFFLAGRDNAVITMLAAMSNGGNTKQCGSTNGATTTPSETADELLGGLLTPGMDRRSCRSRYESPRYFRHFPYTPSAYLVQKLRAYEARHKRCGPGTPLYFKAAERLRSAGAGGNSSNTTTASGGEVPVTDDECRYVVWLPFDGLGNRMLSMLSGFLYALLTDRVLLVALPPDSVDLFCEPFPDATWVVPPDFPVANLFRLGPHPAQAYSNLLQTKAIVVNASTTAAGAAMPPYVFLSIGYDRRIMDKLFFCGEHQRVLGKVSWLLQYSDLYFVPSMFAVPAFRAELRRMFPAALQSVGHLLGRYLFHPTNPVWGLVTRFHDSYLAHAERRISVQVRMFHGVSIPADDMYKQILACSVQERILPAINETDMVAAGGAANVTDNAVGNGSTSTAILVASLYPDYYERLKSRYYEHAASSTNVSGAGATVAVFQPTHEDRQATHSLAHNQKALAEIFLLSFSDELITTGMSTFGYVSSCLAGVRPAILFPAYGHRVPATPCVRAVSVEPCNLTPPLVECPGAEKEDVDLKRHVKVCEDRPQGVKLFDD